MTIAQVGHYAGFLARWCLLIYAMSLSPWPVAIVLSLFGAGIDWLWHSLGETRAELDETRAWFAEYVEADSAFAGVVTRALDQQFGTLDKQEMLSTLRFSARNVVEKMH